MEKDYPGIKDRILKVEEKAMPDAQCPRCRTYDTSKVICGIIGRTINIAVATTKVKLVPNKSAGKYFCNACNAFFNDNSMNFG